MKKKGYEVHGMSEWDNPLNKVKEVHSTQKQYPAKSKIESAGHELKKNPPQQLEKTRKKYGRKAERKQRVAIMLAKARKS